ncbi:hypothetical protein NODU109028_18755 [Nocardioides dubius]|uniref:Lipoprotein n=1 Tax=Nocardioides dubius TaxID=317019 RepID=A0ABN1TJG6_9ACTN
MANRPRRTVTSLLIPLALSLALVGCTGSGDDEEDSGTPPAAAPSSAPLDAAAGRVTGRMKAASRDETAAEVAAVVDAWFEAAYLGEEPGADAATAWPGFTRRLAVQARKDAGLTSNAGLASATATVRKVRVDLLAVKGRAVGATARFRLVLDTTSGDDAGSGAAGPADPEQTDTGAPADTGAPGDGTGRSVLTGRVSLTPAGSGWRIFEYRVARNDQQGGDAQ